MDPSDETNIVKDVGYSFKSGILRFREEFKKLIEYLKANKRNIDEKRLEINKINALISAVSGNTEQTMAVPVPTDDEIRKVFIDASENFKLAMMEAAQKLQEELSQLETDHEADKKKLKDAISSMVQRL